MADWLWREQIGRVFMGGIPGLDGDSQSNDNVFESQHGILDGYVSYLDCNFLLMLVWKDR